jgi:hypothetical protein
LPASGNIDIGGRGVTVAVTSESGRLDVNEADPKLIERALAGLGVQPNVRAEFVRQIQTGRALKERVTSVAELRHLLGQSGVQGAASICVEDQLTLSSGLPQPQPGQVSARLARALGLVVAGTAAVPSAGTAIRIEAIIAGAPRLEVVLRVTGHRDEPLAISQWDYGGGCRNLG